MHETFKCIKGSFTYLIANHHFHFKMDSSKVVQGAEECSSSESGWTMYIDSPDKGYKREDDDDDDDDDGHVEQQGYKKKDDDSDDSMASDASSGPSYQGNLSHAGKGDERKYVGKKHIQQEEKKKKKQHEQKKIEKANNAGRLKKT